MSHALDSLRHALAIVELIPVSILTNTDAAADHVTAESRLREGLSNPPATGSLSRYFARNTYYSYVGSHVGLETRTPADNLAYPAVVGRGL